ncbi:hypothetical protein SRB5_49630 [Streptomyces sp. RB5]|uniref:Uncharacterized protein n=1 Tax=Streptomyces smaragdinus TaxID=2585196 RepID=A0A7K0CMS9_9ACTN|nr:hypothetical protein [Streptomyces smaragdinus]MQY14787.1 hypothetical protein [Streptomyces smaragdinus]
MVATTVAVHANCKDAIHADSERCRRIGAELVAEPRRRPEMVKTWGMPDEEQPDVMEEVGRLRKKGVYPVECEWAVIDAVANPMAAGFNLP